MNLVVYAVPFFILAIVLELAYGWRTHRNTYRLNDSVSSLFLGVLSQTRRFVTLGVGGYVYHLIAGYFKIPSGKNNLDYFVRYDPKVPVALLSVQSTLG